MEGQEEQSRPSLPKRIVKTVVRELRGALPRLEKIRLEEIDEGSVSKTIYWQLGNPLRERFGKNKWANPFTIVDLLANMGHVGIWRDTDYRQKFPEEYQRTRIMLQKLINQGALEVFSAPADLNKETLLYKVKDEKLLKNLVDKAKAGANFTETIQR